MMFVKGVVPSCRLPVADEVRPYSSLGLALGNLLDNSLQQ